MTPLEKFCRDYLDHQLPSHEHRWIEERIAAGDQTVISTLRRLQSEQTGFSFAAKTGESLSSSDKSTESDSQSISDVALSQDGVRNRFVRVITLAAVVLIFFLMYQQWVYYEARQKTELLSQEIEQEREEYSSLEENFNRLQSRFAGLQSVLAAADPQLFSLATGEQRSGTLIFLWDAETAEHALWVDDFELAPGEMLTIWADQNGSHTGLDALSDIEDQAVFSGWTHTELLNASRLEFRIHSTQAVQQREDGELLDSISL